MCVNRPVFTLLFPPGSWHRSARAGIISAFCQSFILLSSSHPQLLHYEQSWLCLLPWFRCGAPHPLDVSSAEWINYHQIPHQTMRICCWICSTFNHTQAQHHCWPLLPRNDTLSGSQKHNPLLMSVISHIKHKLPCLHFRNIDQRMLMSVNRGTLFSCVSDHNQVNSLKIILLSQTSELCLYLKPKMPQNVTLI